MTRGSKQEKARPHSELSRDVYGFTVRPQHLRRYLEHANIYKEEEAERSERWEHFLRTHSKSEVEEAQVVGSIASEGSFEGGFTARADSEQAGGAGIAEKGSVGVPTWGQLPSSLWAVEQALRRRRKSLVSVAHGTNGLYEPAPSRSGKEEVAPSEANDDGGRASGQLSSELEADFAGVGDGSIGKGESPSRVSTKGDEDESEEEFYDAERSDVVQDGADPGLIEKTRSEGQDLCTWEEQLQFLVRGGVPMAFRGQLWQVFVGANDRRVDGHYHALLTLLADGGGKGNGVGSLSGSSSTNYKASSVKILEKWTSQIEKDLPRTFPGHPALDEDGRNTLRRLLTAYARHNPSVGYCQAMNFLAALLLLHMPEENAFWTLTAIMDDYFEGYYSEKMVEAQVDQLVFEQLIRERFPRLVTHLDSLGVQVGWISGPWFLSIFVNVLPWESAGSLMLQRDGGDAVSLLQSMAGATFDSSQLVLTACLGYQDVDEARLLSLRSHHRPSVLAALHERSLELHLWRASNGLTSNNGSTTEIAGSGVIPKSVAIGGHEKPGMEIHVSRPRAVDDVAVGDESLVETTPLSDILDNEDEAESGDLQEQVAWLKVELCRALEDRKAATVRAEELETALMEMVREDNRRLLSAQLEKLKAEVAALRQALSEKQEQEQAMVQVVVRMEQEQHIAEDARRLAEQDAAAQHHAVDIIQEKYEQAAGALGAMEKRAVMAETMLEATLHFQASVGNVPQAAIRRGLESSQEGNGPKGIARSHSSPTKSRRQDADTAGVRRGTAGKMEALGMLPKLSNGSFFSDESDARRPSIFSRPFSLSWRDRVKGRLETTDRATNNLLPGDAAAPVPAPVPIPSTSPSFQEQVNGLPEAPITNVFEE